MYNAQYAAGSPFTFDAQDSAEFSETNAIPKESFAAGDDFFGNYYPPVTEKPAPAKRRSVKKIVLIAAVAVIAVAAIVVGLFLAGVFDTDQIKVLKAFANTADAYSGVSDDLGIPDLSELSEDQQVNQSFSLWLDEYDDMPQLEGIGLRLDAAQNIPDEKMDIALSGYYGSIDLLDAQIKFDGPEIYLSIPQFTDDVFYMINAETLGEDLVDMGVDDEFEDLSFNIFSLIEAANKAGGDSGEILSDALEDFAWDTEVKETGSESINVNGYDLKCTAYEVVIPQEAVVTLVESIEEYVENTNPSDDMIALLEDIGLPDDVVDEFENSTDFDVDFSDLYDVIDDMDDIEMTVYVKNKYVVSVVYEGSYDKQDFTVTIDCGGGNNFADDFSIEFEVEDIGTVSVISSGDHTAESGVFKDETRFIVEEDGEELELISTLSYEPDSDDDNLSWEIAVDEYSVLLEGQLTTVKKGMDLRLDKIGAYRKGKSLGVTLGLEYSIGTYESIIEIEESVDLFELSEAEMQDEFEDIMENGADWYEEISDIVSGF